MSGVLALAVSGGLLVGFWVLLVKFGAVANLNQMGVGSNE